MPVDLRTRQDDAMSAANMCTYSFVTARTGECGTIHDTVEAIRRQTLQIKMRNTASRFIRAVATARYTPRIMSAVLSLPTCGATATVTNVGDPTRRWTGTFQRRKGLAVFGDIEIERFSGVPPVRPRTRAAIALINYRRKLTVAARLDPVRFPRSASETFHGLLMDNLRAFACE
jgi:hypothetical protein